MTLCLASVNLFFPFFPADSLVPFFYHGNRMFHPFHLECVFLGGVSGSQTAAPTFGQTSFGNQAGGTRIQPYTQTPDADSATSGAQPTAKLDSISAMEAYKAKSHEELRWEDYQRGDKGEAFLGVS